MSFEDQNRAAAVLWKELCEQGHVYLVFVGGVLPYIEDPEVFPQENYLEEGQMEGGVLAFVNIEGAQAYKEALPEMHDGLRPSTLTIGEIKLGDLYGMIEELNELSNNEYGHPVRIDIAKQLSDDTILADVLYSKYQLKH